MANPYHSEATSLVRSHWPEATRPVGEMKSCLCGGKYDGAQCQRDDCPRARLGYYGSCHVALSKLWNVASSSSGGNPVRLKTVAVEWCLVVPQVEPSAPSEAPTGSNQESKPMEIYLQPRTSEAMFDMHVSPMSEVDDDPAGAREVPYVVPTHVWLMLLMLPEFSTSCYLNDVVKLAGASRMALEPAVADHLAFIQYMMVDHTTWHEEWCAERSAALDLLEFNAAEFPQLMCLSCGTRPGAEWLGHDECYDCYSEH